MINKEQMPNRHLVKHLADDEDINVRDAAFSALEKISKRLGVRIEKTRDEGR